MEGLTLDTGALVALERRHQRMSQVFVLATQRGLNITIPVIVLAEWWRERTDFADKILRACDVEPMDAKLAKMAGEAQAKIVGATTADALVMASAARRGDLVYTSDIDDLSRLTRHFRSVRVLSA
ncbi:MAG: PIN domain-containing protein [Archangiaceae bacterium]|nr:PIN domain-containing protein [Archangiaceae bacterium]